MLLPTALEVNIRTLVIATHNKGKLKEFSSLLGPRFCQVVGLHELEQSCTWNEDGLSFSENAAIKATSVRRVSSAAILADDSGLCVDALGGKPGIHSSRFAGDEATDRENIELMCQTLRHLKIAESPAFFVCVLAYLPAGDRSQECLYFEGRCDGTVILQPRGTNGFGYDPIFVPLGITRTLAELPDQDKVAISHRNLALQEFLKFARASGELL